MTVSEQRRCYLSFPDDGPSQIAAHELRQRLVGIGIEVLPPTETDTADRAMSSSRFSFHWIRLANVVLLDLTGNVGWVLYEAGAAQALNKPIIPIERTVGDSPKASSNVRLQLPRVVHYDVADLGELVDYITQTLERIAPNDW